MVAALRAEGKPGAQVQTILASTIARFSPIVPTPFEARTNGMALSLEDPETDRLAHAVAALTGEPLTVVVRNALAERLQRERLRRGTPSDLAARLREIGEHCASLPDFDTRTPDEIAGYDETGMWV